jgi:peptide/nickel transport system ATP-binding protein/oligopeptide transport system ATP-binding protein
VNPAQTPILEVRGLKTQFQTRKGIVRAVDGVDLTLHKGETLGVVGESGCGKSVMALSILQLVPKPQGRIADGSILFQGQDLVRLSPGEIRRIRGNDISMIFQEPMTSLNPVFKVGFQIEEVLRLHQGLKGAKAREAVLDMLQLVGIPEPQARIDDYPHQLSGGMRQRIMIAMALSGRPKIMIADEPTTALDVTIQAQILALMHGLKDEIEMSIILITHDLGVVAETAQKVAVMYAGQVVELAEVEELFEHPLHPYTWGLFESLPKAGRGGAPLRPIPGVVPNLFELPSGCAFQDRCSQPQSQCRLEAARLEELRPGHWVRCFNPRGTG